MIFRITEKRLRMIESSKVGGPKFDEGEGGGTTWADGAMAVGSADEDAGTCMS